MSSGTVVPPRGSTFGNTDPTQDTLSPFIWIPLVSTALVCVLFICFRRAQSLELYQRARSYVSVKLASSRWANIRLGSQSTRFDGTMDSDDERSLNGDLDEEDHGDELPTSLPPPRPTIVQRGYKVFGVLGWTGGDKGRGGTVWGGKDGGVARAFWGIRKKDRTGGIRLGADEEEGQVRGGNKGRANRSTNGVTGDRIKVNPGRPYTPSSTAPRSPRTGSPRASSSPRLFDLGEEEEEERRNGEGDAVELPMDFALPGDPLRGGGQSVGARGMQRLG